MGLLILPSVLPRDQQHMIRPTKMPEQTHNISVTHLSKMINNTRKGNDLQNHLYPCQ
jgi:hypothetical protein